MKDILKGIGAMAVGTLLTGNPIAGGIAAAAVCFGAYKAKGRALDNRVRKLGYDPKVIDYIEGGE